MLCRQPLRCALLPIDAIILRAFAMLATLLFSMPQPLAAADVLMPPRFYQRHASDIVRYVCCHEQTSVRAAMARR